MNRRLSLILHFLVLALPVCNVEAQQTPKELPRSASPSSHANPVVPDPGAIANGVYRNSFFGFTYKLPFGWVDRTEDMGAESSDATKGIVLLASFERPPEATGDTVNSAVVIAAEEASSYPGLGNAEHYFGPLTELTKSKGLTVVNQPYDERVGTRPLVRGDFSKELGKLTMHQSTLVMMDKRYVVSFTFIGGTEDEVDELVQGLSFGKKEAPPLHK